jgi:hypothetical protein
LIGAEGSEFVAGLLRIKGPNQAVQELHANYGLQHPLCRPLLHMLDYLDISRREAHVHLLNRARKLLLDWVSSTHASTQQQRDVDQQQGDAPESREEIELQEKLERLLNASFKYMGVRELQQVCSSSSVAVHYSRCSGCSMLHIFWMSLCKPVRLEDTSYEFFELSYQ